MLLVDAMAARRLREPMGVMRWRCMSCCSAAGVLTVLASRTFGFAASVATGGGGGGSEEACVSCVSKRDGAVVVNVRMGINLSCRVQRIQRASRPALLSRAMDVEVTD